ncbi:hypothetical protein C5Y96_02525 [Blastopirellula marina]|uniref:Uncharacterized protein n=1 Tax=Blastopirellula marina TaxID=124 RepID=A0A2S8G2V6_9BACT|nr:MULTISPECIES: hypothetical protein [Pirellulaceae]PQO38776.1 hypothetical protein C5Y96_02525 [Blastopirellula marina]RCS55084.1 hypothetical protein DTL36_02530 [Bremerella cremea]
MPTKQPVLLTVLIETASFRWYVAGIDQEGNTTPLLCSQEGDLSQYVGESFDEQASFLRHRLSGVLQRGCDRLWGKMMKPYEIVFIADNLFREADESLTQRVAEHFDQWMTSPPVVFFLIETDSQPCSPKLSTVAGQIAAEWRDALDKGFPSMISKCGEKDPWELVVSKPHAT